MISQEEAEAYKALAIRLTEENEARASLASFGFGFGKPESSFRFTVNLACVSLILSTVAITVAVMRAFWPCG